MKGLPTSATPEERMRVRSYNAGFGDAVDKCRPYMRHKDECDITMGIHEVVEEGLLLRCTCGLDEIRREATPNRR